MPLHETKQVAKDGRVCFRGDTRLPDEIFRDGFSPRNRPRKAEHVSMPDAGFMAIPVHKKDATIYEQKGMIVLKRDDALEKHGAVHQTLKGNEFRMEMITDQGKGELAHYKPNRNPLVALLPRTSDVFQDTAVCMTPRFSMAVLFPPRKGKPYPDPETDTWIYAVYARKMLNTHGQQCALGLQALQNEFAAREEIRLSGATPKFTGAAMDHFASTGAFWPLYAQEVATCRVEGHDVICAIQAGRVWQGADWTHGCRYTLKRRTTRFNDQCAVDDQVVDAVTEFLDKEPLIGECPSISSGFYKDSAARRTSIDTEFRTASDSKPFVKPGTGVDDRRATDLRNRE
jgi:hypothetical protein